MCFFRLPDGPKPVGMLPRLAGREHRSRTLLTRFLAGDPDADRELRDEYDQQSDGWTAWCAGQPDYVTPVADALDRLRLPRAQTSVLEVGCGTGQGTRELMRRFSYCFAADASEQMLRRLPPGTNVGALAADVRALPFATATLDLVVGLNAVPDFTEFARVLRPGGRVLWASSFRDHTPLYIAPEELCARWPWGDGTGANAGHGDWVVLDRP